MAEKTASSSKEKKNEITYKYTKKFLAKVSLASILLGWWFGFMLWGNSMVLSLGGIPLFGGLGATVFIIGLVLVALWISKTAYNIKIKKDLEGVLDSKLSWSESYRKVYYVPFWLAGWMILVSFSFLYRIEVYTYSYLWIFYIITIPALLAFLFSPLYPRVMNILYMITFMIKTLAISIIEGIKFIWEGPSNLSPTVRKRSVTMLILGLLLAFIMAWIFSWLLSRADPVFESYISRFWDEVGNLLKHLELGRYGRIFFVLTAPLAIAGVVFTLLRYSHQTVFELPNDKIKKRLEIIAESIRQRSDVILHVVILGTLNLVFWLFVFIQIRYIFFGTNLDKILEDYTYAEYAQRGFVEMLIAAVLAYPIISFFASRTNFKSKALNFVSGFFNLSMVAALWVVLASAFHRIELYQDAYGYSLRRFFVLLGVIIVAIVLVAYVSLFLFRKAKGIRERFQLFGFRDYYLLALFGLVALFTLTVMIPWPILITKANINRYIQTGDIDLVYMYNGPDETIPALYKFSNDLIEGDISAKNVTDSQQELTGVLLRENLQNRLTDINKDIIRHKNEDGDIQGSWINKIGGFNFIQFYNGYVLYDEMFSKEGQLVDKKHSKALDNEVKKLLQDYAQEIEDQDFEQARQYWDSTFTSIKTDKFADEVVIQSYTVNLSFMEENYQDKLTGEGSVTDIPVCITYTTGFYSRQYSIKDYLSIGVRDGQVVIKDSTRLPLAYQDYSCEDGIYDKCEQYEVFNSYDSERWYYDNGNRSREIYMEDYTDPPPYYRCD